MRSAPVISDDYTPFPRQKQFHTSGAKYRLFGGAAGPGKTKALLWEAIQQANEVDGCDTLLLRRTYPELESSLLAYFRRDVPRSRYRKYSESKHIVTWSNGSTTRFGYCRNENDVYQYQGAEFLFIGIDELTHFTLKQWQFLTSRNRCPVKTYSGGRRAGKTAYPCMAGATNPGNIGHAWVKALWVDHVPPPGFERPELYHARDYDFIRARLDDNPIYANDTEYRKTLEALPEHLRRAFLEGDWNVFAGQYFDVFDVGRHTARPEELRLEPWWPRWISVDWGFQHPSAVYWHCAIPVNSRQFKVESKDQPQSERFPFDSRLSTVNSRIVTYREFVQNGLSPRMLAQAIAERSGRERINEVFLSPDAFAHRTAEASIAEQLGDVLVANGLPRPAAADDDRIGGWQFMYQLLESDAWVITENCAKLIECLPLLVRDNHRIEDIRKVEGDDPADAARYGLVSGGRLAGVGAHFAPPRAGQSPPFQSAPGTPHFVTGMPLGEQIARQVSATDPTSRAIHYQRLENEAKKHFRPQNFPGGAGSTGTLACAGVDHQRSNRASKIRARSAVLIAAISQSLQLAQARVPVLLGALQQKMKTPMKDFFERLLRGRYVGLLEGEVARLRAENRALTNSLLGTAGFPPVDYPEAVKPQSLPRLRKRSWHQIQAWRETKATREADIERHSASAGNNL